MNSYRAGLKVANQIAYTKIVFTQPVRLIDSCVHRWRVVTDGANLDPLKQLALAGDDVYNSMQDEQGIAQICDDHHACFPIMEGCPRGTREFHEGDEVELYSSLAKGIVEKGWAKPWED